MTNEEQKLLHDIMAKVKDKPEYIKHINEAIVYGVERANKELREHVADAEAALFYAIYEQKPTRKTADFILSKLNRWADSFSLNRENFKVQVMG